MKYKEVFLKHILDEINFLLEKTNDIAFEKFIEDEVLKRACARSLEIIGEAVKNLPQEFKNKYNNISWKKLAGLRDKVIHHYFGVDWDIVWDVIKNHLKGIKEQILIILK